LFDVNVNNSITGNVNTYSTNATTTTISIGNTTAGQVYSTSNNAYQGAKLKITTGPGTGESPKFITAHVGATGNLTIASPFIATLNSQSKFSIDFEFNDAENFSTFSGTTLINSGDIDTRSKTLSSDFDDAVLSDSSFEPLIFPLGQQYIVANSIADFSYTQRRLYPLVSFTSGVSGVLTLDTNESLSTATTDSAKLEKYQVIVTTQGSSPYGVGQTVPVISVTAVNTVDKQITVASGGSMVANIITTVDFTLASGNPAKTKTSISANTTVQTTGGEVVNTSGAVVFLSSGQTHIQANNIVRTPGSLQTLYVPDVTQIVKVLDFNNTAITVANTAAAANVTTYYELETGQKDSFYDHSSIK
jgi:hypothetical protein